MMTTPAVATTTAIYKLPDISSQHETSQTKTSRDQLNNTKPCKLKLPKISSQHKTSQTRTSRDQLTTQNLVNLNFPRSAHNTKPRKVELPESSSQTNKPKIDT
jgi:hypothetical protein